MMVRYELAAHRNSGKVDVVPLRCTTESAARTKVERALRTPMVTRVILLGYDTAGDCYLIADVSAHSMRSALPLDNGSLDIPQYDPNTVALPSAPQVRALERPATMKVISRTPSGKLSMTAERPVLHDSYHREIRSAK